MVEIEELRPALILQAAGGPEQREEIVAALRAWLGDPPPTVPGRARSRGSRTVMALAPGRWLLVALTSAPPPEGAAVVLTDLSASRLVLRLTGPGLETMLRKGVGFDPAPGAFPPGRIAQTLLHHMPVLLHRTDEGAVDLYVPQSWGHAVRHWLGDAGPWRRNWQDAGYGSI
jgi:sarcosine oxidase subunit gamma